MIGRPAKQLIDALSKHDDLPNLIISCKSSMVSSSYLEQLLSVYYGGDVVSFERTQTCIFDSIEYRTCQYFHEINLDCVQNSDRCGFTGLLNSIVDHHSFSKRRNVIILTNVDHVQKNLECTLNSIIEKHFQTTWFILVTSHPSGIHQLLKSRCFCINVNISLRLLYDQLYMAISELKLDNVDRYRIPDANLDEMLTLCDNDPLNLGILVELQHCENYRTHLFAFVTGYFDRLIELFNLFNLSPSTNSYTVYASLVRELAIKINTVCIPLKFIGLHILKYVHLYYPCKTHNVLQSIVEMEHLSHTINKQIFVMETYFDNIVRTLCCDS